MDRYPVNIPPQSLLPWAEDLDDRLIYIAVPVFFLVSVDYATGRAWKEQL